MAHNSDSYVKLGCAIYGHRRRLQLSQAAVAERSGLDRAYFGSIERGERRPSYGRVLDIAKALDLTGAQLVKHAESASLTSTGFASAAHLPRSGQRVCATGQTSAR